MRIISDDPQSWKSRLSGWSALTGAESEMMGDQAQIPLWNALAPEKPSFQAVATPPGESQAFWQQIFLVESASTSQYDVLREFFAEDPVASPGPIACLAYSGQGFHGQRQRPWSAVAGNLHLSVSVPLDVQDGPNSLFWTMLPAVAVMRTLEELGLSGPYLGSDRGIKWVNDVLWGGRKLAGVISSVVSQEGRLVRGYLGIGLNMEVAPVLSDGNLGLETTCLKELLPDQKIEPGRVLDLVLEALARLIQGFGKGGEDRDEVFQEYRRFSLVVGRSVRIVTDPMNGAQREICRGKVMTVASDLGLEIEGQSQRVHEGRLILKE